ncbi:LOW QUALITY PROTEIN: mitochondrial potassium channel [Menidia menidia]
MRYRGAQICLWARGSGRLILPGRTPPLRVYSVQQEPPPSGPSPPELKGGAEILKERTVSALRYAGDVARQWGQRSAQTASATANYWWERYEEFVGLNEVREAQTKVTEAESAFMVARGIVREAHVSLEALQVRLKEVRDRLDRVSREEAHYLELATLEHKLLQEERRLRTAHANAEGAEREKFALFSAGVRESHEKERTRAERTKNWSIVGSVLGALIGVMGSTYVNRVRLQELKSLLLEAQKGPESLQEALRVQAGNHRGQQDELRALIGSLRAALAEARRGGGGAPRGPRGPGGPGPGTRESRESRESRALLEALPPQLGQLEQGLGRLQGELQAVRGLLEARVQEENTRVGLEGPEGGGAAVGAGMVVRSLNETQRTLGDQIRTSSVHSAAFSYTAAAITVSALYLLLRGAG